ncbi:MAG: hypothetical protein HY075_02390, partial [Deltaproteobacteria bacterium]|nr:hypothetical protein [Deltaproteobacteria bacterium]
EWSSEGRGKLDRKTVIRYADDGKTEVAEYQRPAAAPAGEDWKPIPTPGH